MANPGASPSATKPRVRITREHAGLTARGLIAELILQIVTRVALRFRRKRLAEFERRFPPTGYNGVIDVGGTFQFWEGTTRNVTIVNPAVPTSTVGTVTSLEGDGKHLPFPDKSFRLAFSNSVIEHMKSGEEQRQFARELSRVGVALYCQTPNRWFPVDVHYVCVFLHWWPKLLRNYYVARYLTGWGWTFKPDRKAVQEWAHVVNLLTEEEFTSMFPDCTIVREKFLGMTKSFIAVRTLGCIG
jgi:hypothetical protein